MVDPKQGRLRVWWVRNPPNPPSYTLVLNPKQARQLLDSLALTDLKDTQVWGNAGGLEVYQDGEWVEWQDDKGNIYRE